MQENIFENEVIPPQRPQFLKVLCILTFIWSCYTFINSAITYFNADTIAKAFIEAKTKVNEDVAKNKKQQDSGDAKLMTNIMSNVSKISTPENLRKTSIGNFSTQVLCLVGAILMWRLRRTGFYIYTLGTIIGIILPFYLFGSNFLTNISAGFMGFIGLLFVIFYAMNLKSMK